MWVMLGEMFPNQIRGSGLAISGFAHGYQIFNYYDISYFTCDNRLRDLWDICHICSCILVFIIKFVKEQKELS